MDCDGSQKGGRDCIVGCNRALIDGAGHGNNSSNDSLLLSSAKRAVGHRRCARGHCDDCSAVDGRCLLSTICLTSDSLGTAGNAGDGALGANSLNSGGCDSTGDETGRTTAKNNSTGLNLGGNNSHGGCGGRTRVGANAKSRIESSNDVCALNGTVVCANTSRALEGSADTNIRG